MLDSRLNNLGLERTYEVLGGKTDPTCMWLYPDMIDACPPLSCMQGCMCACCCQSSCSTVDDQGEVRLRMCYQQKFLQSFTDSESIHMPTCIMMMTASLQDHDPLQQHSLTENSCKCNHSVPSCLSKAHVASSCSLASNQSPVLSLSSPRPPKSSKYASRRSCIPSTGNPAAETL